MPAILIITAAGNSTRMGGDVKKEYLTISETKDSRVTVLSSALYAFLETGLFSTIAITVPQGGEAEARAVLAEDGRIADLLAKHGLHIQFAEGGSSRQESVMNGLLAAECFADDDSVVLIHDGARPWVSDRIIRDVLAGVQAYGASVPGIPSIDTQKETDANGKIVRHLDRSRIVSVQTPQGFRFAPLLEAHKRAAQDGKEYTDDTEIWGRYAGDVHVCAGDRANKKITWPGDLQ